MKNRWNETDAAPFLDNPLKVRVYTSRLLGAESDLVLHGGGNTSVKINETNLFGEEEEILYVKGSGWDLATIEEPGFAPVKMATLLKMAELEALTDTEMVKNQRAAMTNPNAPNPSVEAILHAAIPYTFVDHTHADAVVTVSNTPNGEEHIRKLYPDCLIVPYVMPGFILAKKIYEMTRDVDWDSLKGMILLNHGVFTFDEDGKKSYDKMIELVTRAEDYLAENGASVNSAPGREPNLEMLANIRRSVSGAAGRPFLARLDQSFEAAGFSELANVDELATRGPVTPDHSIRTKRIAAIYGQSPEKGTSQFVEEYERYFGNCNDGMQQILDPAPRWGVWKGVGTLAFGRNAKECRIIHDIANHTVKCIQQADALGGWKALSAKDIFDVEYWELEQAKLKKAGSPPELDGKIAIVTGAFSGIGKACVDALRRKGAVVAALDIDPKVVEMGQDENILGLQCDVTSSDQMQHAVEATIRRWGGIDILVSNAGTFPASATLDALDLDHFQKSLDVNLIGHHHLLKAATPYLRLGLDPSVVIIASKNVHAPGKGAAAYSVAKAGLTQMGRIAALELAPHKVRVNMLHPDSVYDTGIWTDEVLKARAEHYGLSVQEYKTRNLLKKEISSREVAELAAAMAGRLFAGTTGAQIPIDGGNERVI